MKISVIIPVYNAEEFLEKAVNSALQFPEVREVLLIEDKSPDNSLEICKKLVTMYSRVKLYQHADQGNYGAGATRNLGIEKATQDFIAFLDADDYYLPNRFDVEKQLFLDAKIEGVFGAIGTDFLSEKGKQEYQQKFKYAQITTVKRHAEGKDVFYGLVGLDKSFGIFFHLNGLTIRRKSLIKRKIRFNENLRVHQDTDFIIKLSYNCYLKSGEIVQPIAMRGVHDDNRITKIKPYSSKFYNNMYLLYKSRFQWSKSQIEMSANVKKFIKLRYITFKLGNTHGVKKLTQYFFYLLRYPELLKTSYRFHILKNK